MVAGIWTRAKFSFSLLFNFNGCYYWHSRDGDLLLKCLKNDEVSINLGELLTNNTPDVGDDFESQQIGEQWESP
ncbi:MAG: hypothetical protein R2728_14835 [Chitinophagales bacterium]